MTAAHTPGPWWVSKRNPLRVIESGPRGHTLATASTKGRGVTADGAQQEAEANARLIAAAPDLLEALKLADAMLSGANMNAAVVQAKVHAAIAKATGGAA